MNKGKNGKPVYFVLQDARVHTIKSLIGQEMLDPRTVLIEPFWLELNPWTSVMDQADAQLIESVKGLNIQTRVTNTLMNSLEDRRQLAVDTLDFIREVA